MAAYGRWIRAIIVVGILPSWAPTSVRGDDLAWIGQHIILRRAATTPVAGEQAVLAVDDGVLHVYRVERVEGPRLYVSDDAGMRRWVEAAEAVLVSRAIDELDDQLATDPASASAYRDRGLLRQQTGDLIQPFADYAAALRLAPEDGLTH